MGGNAVPGVSRADPELYTALKARVHAAMRKHFGQVATPQEFPNKASYGDVDVVYAPHSCSIVKDVIATEFGDESASRAVVNGKTVSFPLDNVQVDLIGETCEKFNIAVAYYSYGDLGRIIGAICHFYGLRWGKTGLIAPINCRNASRPAVSHPWNTRDNEAIPSDDWRSPLALCDRHGPVFQFLGLDCGAFDAGFQDETQIWSWVTSSPYFDIDIFSRPISLVLADATICDKAKIREAYYRFLMWLNMNASEQHAHSALPNPVVYFKKEEDVQAMVDAQRRHELRKEKFSGRLLVEAGIEQRHIGTILTWLRQHYERTMTTVEGSNICMDEWVECNSGEEIKQWTLEAVAQWRMEHDNGGGTS